jgi:hypothetical protein
MPGLAGPAGGVGDEADQPPASTAIRVNPAAASRPGSGAGRCPHGRSAVGGDRVTGHYDGAVSERAAGEPELAQGARFNTVCWSYVHLRGRHRWAAPRARQGLRALIAPGLAAGPPGPAAR